MWCARYFNPRYWAERFWAKVGAVSIQTQLVVRLADYQLLASGMPVEETTFASITNESLV